MVEEADSKWVKVADRGNKGSFTNHRSFRGEGDGSRHRSSRREEHRAEGQGQGQGGSNRSSSGFSRRAGQDSSCRI
ncbi:BnaAnng26830D [Brassica napus]|uniref:BnaAnng26830D protein n=1 Tax=Brassica napus TaxID=3708 RepID=A0A078JPG0_BRANA|nr:BnaAnng26830D [Brassica napus]